MSCGIPIYVVRNAEEGLRERLQDRVVRMRPVLDGCGGFSYICASLSDPQSFQQWDRKVGRITSPGEGYLEMANHIRGFASDPDNFPLLAVIPEPHVKRVLPEFGFEKIETN